MSDQLNNEPFNIDSLLSSKPCHRCGYIMLYEDIWLKNQPKQEYDFKVICTYCGQDHIIKGNEIRLSLDDKEMQILSINIILSKNAIRY